MRTSIHSIFHTLIVGCSLLASQTSLAANFEIAAAPSRFHLSGKSGARVGQSLDLYNLGKSSTEVSLRTMDWSFTETGVVSFFDELQPNSCRTWVTLERKSVAIAAGQKRQFRFQVDVPADAPRGECRFMLAVEGVEPTQRIIESKAGANLNLPVIGRIALAVYVAVNGGAPKLELTQLKLGQVKGQNTAFAVITNTGDAHGRLEGALDAVDANGKEFDLSIDNSPVLPGQVRSLQFTAKELDKSPAPPAGTKAIAIMPVFPIKVKGILDWENGSFKIDTVLK